MTINPKGSGSDTWMPPVSSTGICYATAGYVTGGVYTPVTERRELTPERLKAGTFPDSTGETLRVYYCNQFFKNDSGGEPYASTFAQYVYDAMRESWQTQVNSWGLGSPPDADKVHKVFVSDTEHWYHTPPVGRDSVGPAVSDSGPNRQITITHDPGAWNDNYTNDDSLVRTIIAHEFHHGIQTGLSHSKSVRPWWRWFAEAQARCVQSAQCDSEEFKNRYHNYPWDVNKLLTKHLNTSLVVLSLQDTLLGYPYAIFWRYIKEKFGSDGVHLVRDCYAQQVDSANSITNGKRAVDMTLASYHQSHPNDTGPTSFFQALDRFAIACYLDSGFGLWHDPHSVYAAPSLTASDTFKVGPNEVGSFIKIDSIPFSYGIDLLQVVLDGNVDTLGVSLVRHMGAGGKLNARVVKVYQSAISPPYIVDTAFVDTTTAPIYYKVDTRDAKRACLVMTSHDTLDHDSCQ